MLRRAWLGGGLSVLVSGWQAACAGRARRDPGAEPRVVSTSPSMTEIVFAIGRGAALVGRTRFCDHPPEAQKVEVIGGFADPSLERVVALAPTLVCGERGPAGPELPAALEARGIQVYFPPMDGVAEVRAAIEELGAKLGAAERGRAAAGELGERIEDVGRRVRDLSRPRVLFLFDWKPLVAAGPRSFPDELLRLAGAENVVTVGDKYPRLGLEGIVALAPEVIVDGSGHGDAAHDPTEELPGLLSVPAVRAGRLVRLGSTAALRPGPRLGAGLEELAAIVHGRAFTDRR